MTLKAEAVVGRDSVLKSAALVVDTDLEDDSNGNAVAFVIYTEGGHIIYWHRRGTYDLLDVLFAGETYIGDSFRADRVKEYDVEVRKKAGP